MTEPQTFSRRYATFIHRHHRLVLLGALALTAAAVPPAIWLYMDLRPNVEELLPRNAPGVKDLEVMAERLGGYNGLNLVVQSDDPRANMRFSDDLVARVRTHPMIKLAQNHIKDEKEFFRRNQWFFMELEDLQTLRDRIAARVEYEHKKGFDLGLDDEAPPPPPGTEEIEKKYRERAGELDAFPTGYFTSPDGLQLVVSIRSAARPSDVDAALQLSRDVHALVAELDPHKYEPNMVVGFGGDVQNLVEEHDALLADLMLSSVLVMIAVSLALVYFYRRWRAIPILVVPLLMSTSWCFAISYFVIGNLNSNTAFLGSIVIGNGINFGIIWLARYLEERRRGREVIEALDDAIRFTAVGTSIAAFAAGTAYASLLVSQVRGFNQFGFIGGIGMVLCWLGAFTVLPATTCWFERGKSLMRPERVRKLRLAEAVAQAVERHPRWISGVSIALTLVSVPLVYHFLRDPYEYDMSKLRNKWSRDHGSGYWDRFSDRIFKANFVGPIAILVDDPALTPQVEKAISERRARGDGAGRLIGPVRTAQQFVPPDQDKKLPLIREVRRLLTGDWVKAVDLDEREKIRAATPAADLATFGMHDLPPNVRKLFTERDGTIGRVTLVVPAIEMNLWDARSNIQLFQAIREAVDGIPTVRISGIGPVFIEVLHAIEHDGPRASAIALVGVVLLIIVAFRSVRYSALSIVGLAFGVVWFGGVMGAFDLKLNILNFIALPITFGIGVDYVANVLARQRHHPEQPLGDAIRNTGGAVALCSLTTILGYSSLLVSSNQALFSFGLLANVGEITCLVAALFAVPALVLRSGVGRAAARPAAESGPPKTGTTA
jgi:hypothetical protein